MLDLPFGKFRDKGTPIDNLSNYNSSEENFVYITNLGAICNHKLIFGTKMAMLKIVDGSEFDVAKRTTAATKLTDGDEVLLVHPVAGNETIVMQSERDFFLRIAVDSIPEKKKGAVGRPRHAACGRRCAYRDSSARRGRERPDGSKRKVCDVKPAACGGPRHERNEEITMIKAVLFDLDGTIINSEEGITKCVQYALHAYGIDEPDRTKLRCFIGPPLDPVFREKYGMTEAEAWQSVEKYRERFDVKGIFECSLYDGVREAIARFKEHGYLLALASSKPETACRRILEHFDLLGYFDEVVGSTLDGSISTKAEVLEELGRRMAGSHIGKNELCLIGDTKYDAAGAKAFGIRCIGVSYGFGTREELLAAGAEAVFGRIEEVEAYIENDEVKEGEAE